MDVWALNPKAGGLAWRASKEQERSLMVTRPISQWKYFGIEEGNARLRAVWEVRVLGRTCYRSLMVRATGQRKDPENPSSSGQHLYCIKLVDLGKIGIKEKKCLPIRSFSQGNNDPSFPRGDDPEQSNPDPDGSKSDDQSLRPKNILSDWRDFRASLVAREQVKLLDSDSPTHDNKASGFLQQSSTKWAHPLPMPETGCVLVATEKLDGVRSFERTVVLLLRSGTRDREEGPFGVIINRPLHKKIKHIKPSNPDLASTFADCSLNFGGPLDSSMFLLRTGETSPLPNLEQVIPGIRFGARNSLDEAAALVKKGVLRAQDFRFFVGYAGWQLDQLKEEIESDYWIVAACSSDLIAGVSADSCSVLWEEILQLMGGQYSELSKKPKQDSS